MYDGGLSFKDIDSKSGPDTLTKASNEASFKPLKDGNDELQDVCVCLDRRQLSCNIVDEGVLGKDCPIL